MSMARVFQHILRVRPLPRTLSAYTPSSHARMPVGCQGQSCLSISPRRTPPPRTPSALPPPGNLTLKCSLGIDIGSGRSGIVFQVDQLTLNPVHGSLPPLVVKVGRRNRCLSVGREAWFYDELEHLQGVVIPRCYGWFELVLQPGWSVPCWRNYAGEYDYQDDSEPIEYAYTLGMPAVATHEPQPHPMAVQLAGERERVYILLLERAGESICTGPEPTLQQLEDAYSELADRGVMTANDVRVGNILWAPKSPPGFPSLPSPFTGIVHSLRIIDFGYSFKTDMVKNALMQDNRSWFQTLAVDYVRPPLE